MHIMWMEEIRSILISTANNLPDWVALIVVPYTIFVSLYFALGFTLLSFDFIKPLNNLVRKYKCQSEKSPTIADVKRILSVTIPQILFLYPVGLIVLLPILRNTISQR